MPMKRPLLTITLKLFIGINMAMAQNSVDTVRSLQEVVVKAYFTEQPVLRLPASISVLSAAQLQNQPPTSLVPLLNTVPGVRMEERSPGSYRLSIRGSLLRSPFGVRNVKIYMDEFPITDPGGNTYLNLLDTRSVNRLEILKGPEASIFGANSGGVVLINPNLNNKDGNAISANLSGGSYGLFYENLSFQKGWNKSHLSLNQAYQTSNGYRDNSDLRRSFGSANYQWKYSGNSQLRSMLLYSDLNYQTPGGLTATQMQANPQSARLPTATLPGAVQQKARVHNKTLYAGVLNETSITPGLRHLISVFGSFTDFQNSAILNYEEKDEGYGGVRTYLDLKTEKPSLVNFNWQLGVEAGHGSSDVSVFDNNGGTRGGQRSSNRLNTNYSFIFSHLSADFNRWYFEAAASLNFNNYKYRSLVEPSSSFQKKKFDEQLMPRFAASYQITDDLAWRASVSKGYSPPTIDEVTGSNNVINTDLQPEKGWNYETGFRYRSSSDRLYFDAVIFRYDLNDAIVRRLDESDVVYFINAGGTKQVGVESQIIAWLVKPSKSGFLRSLQLNNSFTYSHFKFTDYQNGTDDFSGNRLTGVPKHTVVTGFDFQFPLGLYVFSQHNYTSSIPLNDANQAFADKYHLVQLKAGWRKEGKRAFNLYFGIDNLLDEEYSLGNDLNAAGSRYFNPSPPRNYYIGLSTTFK
jgi:iron complex outermembrane recepter protein